MMLSASDMAQALGVSRISYHNWVGGMYPRKKNEDAVKHLVRKLITVMQLHDWPNEEVRRLPSKERSARLLALLQQQ
jgi:hypothetical protein